MPEQEVGALVTQLIGNSPIAAVLLWIAYQLLQILRRTLDRHDEAVDKITMRQDTTHSEVIATRRDISDLPDKIAARIKT